MMMMMMMAGVTLCVLKRSLGNSPLINRIIPRISQHAHRSFSDIPGVKERTLVAIKPDGVQRRMIGQIIKRFEQRGFRLVGLKMVQVSEELLGQHYVNLRKKPFYPSVLQYMTSGPVVAMVWEGHNVIKSTRKLVGDTNPAEAEPGTLRGDFSIHVSRFTTGTDTGAVKVQPRWKTLEHKKRFFFVLIGMTGMNSRPHLMACQPPRAHPNSPSSCPSKPAKRPAPLDSPKEQPMPCLAHPPQSSPSRRLSFPLL